MLFSTLGSFLEFFQERSVLVQLPYEKPANCRCKLQLSLVCQSPYYKIRNNAANETCLIIKIVQANYENEVKKEIVNDFNRAKGK